MWKRSREVIAKTTFRSVFVGFTTLYLLIFSVLAWQRWGCRFPWSNDCLTTAADRFEAAILFSWVRDWDTFGGAIATLVAAIVAAWALRADANSRRRAVLNAERAGLTLVLKDLDYYATSSLEVVLDVLGQVPSDPTKPYIRVPSTVRIRIAPPPLPESCIAALSSVIASADQREANLLANLVTQIQIQHARLQSLGEEIADPDHVMVRSQLLRRAAEAIYIHAAAGDLYGWCRRRTERLDKPIGRSKLGNSFSVLRLDDLYDDRKSLWTALHEEAGVEPPKLDD